MSRYRKATHPGFFRRHDREQERLLLSTMPRTGVVEYDDLLPKVELTGKVWRGGKVLWRDNETVGTRKAVR